MYNNKVFNNLLFDKDAKTFTITNGSEGTYSYKHIVKCNVVNEDAKHRGKSPIFSHTVFADFLQPWGLSPKDVFVGVEFIMEDASKGYSYVSDEKVQINTLKYHGDRKKGQDIKEFVKRIINKYQKKI